MFSDNLYDHVEFLPRTIFEGFEKLEDLEIGLWQLSRLDNSNFDQGPPMSHEHESTTSLMEILPQTLKSLEITGRGDARLIAPLKTLARARKDCPTYEFSKLSYVAVELTRIHFWDKW